MKIPPISIFGVKLITESPSEIVLEQNFAVLPLCKMFVASHGPDQILIGHTAKLPRVK